MLSQLKSRDVATTPTETVKKESGGEAMDAKVSDAEQRLTCDVLFSLANGIDAPPETSSFTNPVVTAAAPLPTVALPTPTIPGQPLGMHGFLYRSAGTPAAVLSPTQPLRATTSNATASSTATNSSATNTTKTSATKMKSCPKQHQLPLFLSKTYHMIDKCDIDIATWSATGDNFFSKRCNSFNNILLTKTNRFRRLTYFFLYPTKLFSDICACILITSTFPLYETYHMIDKCDIDIATWSATGDNFVVKNVEKFASAVLPLYFKHSNFSSFARQLNFYGFRKLRSDPILTNDVDPQTSCYVRFYHEKFQKNKPELLHSIKRATKSDQQSKDDVDDLKSQVQKLKKCVMNMSTEMEHKIIEINNEYNRRISTLDAEYEKLASLVGHLLQQQHHHPHPQYINSTKQEYLTTKHGPPQPPRHTHYVGRHPAIVTPSTSVERTTASIVTSDNGELPNTAATTSSSSLSSTNTTSSKMPPTAGSQIPAEPEQKMKSLSHVVALSLANASIPGVVMGSIDSKTAPIEDASIQKSLDVAKTGTKRLVSDEHVSYSDPQRPPATRPKII
eukprot:CAMPEP_0201277722 /NCGR_PEP_ID=MMETSP0853-20130426/59714_1 /ASSEMBLY_ACC=CAM_ASM_000640 /TAXON_ID=183588 /ORGANISM="Pseudo-nitzschia fraudulenta, Strain WWA7" /LENGTH=561 /DNA_ID=CAMNT_0047585919 /DNA_START=283 /DNA_END=1970 /DNA_ORIENTATION=-